MGMRFFKVGWVLLWLVILTAIGATILKYGFWKGVQSPMIATIFVGLLCGIILGFAGAAISLLPSYLFWGDSDHSLILLWRLPWDIEERIKEKQDELEKQQKEVDYILRKEGLPY